MKIISIVIFLSLFLFSCSKNENQILFENNIKCADIALKYWNFIEKKSNYKLDNYSMNYKLEEYFYSSDKKTCIWVFLKRIVDGNTEKTNYVFTDLLNNKDIFNIEYDESLKNSLISDYK